MESNIGQEKTIGRMRMLVEQKDMRMLFFLCWVVYCTSYIGRLNYSSAMSVMIAGQVIDASEGGFISMMYFFAYGVGQMINGFLGDYVNPKRIIFCGLFFSGVANIMMGVCHHFVWMALMWGINGYTQSMIWTPIIRIFAEMMDEKNKLKSSVNIVTSMVIGTLFSYLMSAVVLSLFPWQGVFFTAAALLILTALIWVLGFGYLCSRTSPAEEKSEDEGKTEKEELHRISFCSILIHSGIAAMFLPVIVHGILKDGVTAWVPTYIAESFAVSPSFSVLLTTVLPVVNLTGAYMARYVYQKFKKSIPKSVGIFFAAATGALFFLYVVGKVSPILAVLLLAVITSSMLAVNTLLINLYPLRFQKYGRVSGISGFLNSLAYLGTAVSTYTIGILVQYRGWQVTILSWLFITALAGAVCVITIKYEMKKEWFHETDQIGSSH